MLNSKTKIIVVDDDQSVIDQISRVLNGIGARNIATFTEEKAATIALSKSLYDLAIIDMRMPNNDGIKLINYLKNNFDKKIQKTPLMTLFGSISDPEIKLISEFNFTRVVKKPFTDQIFIEELNKSMFSADVAPVTSAIDEVDFEQACKLGMEAIYTGNLESAREYIKPKLMKDPSSPRLNSMMGQIYFNEGNYGIAGQQADRVLANNRNYLPAMNLKTKVYVAMGAWENALAMMEEAQKLSPLNIQRLVGMGEIHLANGRLQMAHDKFQKALEICPTSEVAIVGMAKVKIEMGDIDEGMYYLNQIEDVGGAVSDINLKAVMLSKAGKFKESVLLYDRAIKCCTFPKLISQLHYNKALAYIRGNRTGAAKDSLEDSLQSDKENIKSQDLLARLNMGIVPDLGNNGEFEVILSDRQKQLLMGTVHVGVKK
jgi:CheY-like chemotaxis protein/lipopolysaccharide biosynthesis regulator YciM